ncbi:MAG: insulinase family protein [Clostridiales bacterium]|nr:insulinase family protein [Clostridiales bacterium]
MNLNINDNINGFTLLNKENIDDINSVGYLFKHEKSGARLMYIENDDDNKVFSISFKTPPEDDCGTPHIIEHSVLCGSEKYPVKDPFNELAKGSLNTYLNALTYSDKTVYPIASRNDKDFMNLMDVYMDAVFNPLMLKHKEIFMQEGHHLHLENAADPLEIRGVVYNEMKGAYSDPDRYLDGAVNTALFPDSIYRFESGGDPDKIPELTYEQFIDFYKKHYHPSNSYIYLFGKMDIEEKTAYFDKEYLSKFDAIEINNEIKHQESQNKIIRKEEYYPVVEKGENEAMYAASYIVGDSCDEESSLGYGILSYILTDTNASPIRKALTESGFCSDTEGWFDSSIKDTVFTIAAKEAEESALDKFEKTVTDELKKLVNEGIDKELLNSAVNAFEFMLSEENFGYKPRGLYYGLKSMNSWLHKDNPFESFRFKKLIASIRSKIDEGYFEKLIADGMTNNETQVFVSLQPKVGMQAELDEAAGKRLDEYKQSLSAEQIEKIAEDTKNLLKFQSADEDLSVVPSLKLDDIDKKAEFIESGIRDGIFYVPDNTNGVIYAELAFDVSDFSKEDYNYIGLLSDVIGRLDTEKYGFSDLPTKMDMCTGGITASCSANYGEEAGLKKKLTVSAKALSRNADMLIDLVDQTVNKMVFTKTDSLRLIIKDRISKLENYLTQNGHMTAASRALSYFSEGRLYKDCTSGVDYFKFLCQIDRNFDDGVAAKLAETAKKVFNKNNLTLAISCEEGDFEKAKALNSLFAERNIIINPSEVKLNTKSEGIITPGKIQYVAKAADFKKAGFEYSGKMRVLKNIIDLEYLWNTVRVQGGAYGCGCEFLNSGGMYMYSYRDPNLKRTIDIYNAAGDFIEKFNADERAMTNYIIGAINTIDRPLNKEQRLKTALSRYISGVSAEKLQKTRDEVLSTTLEDIRSYAPMLRTFEESPYICVIGNGDSIENEKEMFESVITLKM